MKLASAYLATAILVVIGPTAAASSVVAAGRPGETVVVSVGGQKGLSRQTVAVTVTASGRSVTYEAGDPRIRAVVNVYPDPLSRLRAATPGSAQHQPDAWDTHVYFDLPLGLDIGTAHVEIRGPQGSLTGVVPLEILPGIGAPLSPEDASLAGNALAPLERTEHATIAFSGPSVPHSIQIELSYTAGAAVVSVINTRGDLKNLVWADHGSRLIVLMTPVAGRTLREFRAFEFYVTGGVTDLQVNSLRAYDVTGARLPGVSARVE
jgi:hypothetical protein